MSNFSFCVHVFNSVKLLYFHLKGVSNKNRVFSKSSAAALSYVEQGLRDYSEADDTKRFTSGRKFTITCSKVLDNS